MFFKRKKQHKKEALSDFVKKIHETDYTFLNINNDLGRAVESGAEQWPPLLFMAYGYARRAAISALYIQGLVDKDLFEHVKAMFIGFQQQTDPTYDFQEKAAEESIKFMSEYSPLINTFIVKKIVQIAEEYEIPSIVLSDAELFEHTIDTAYFEQNFKDYSAGSLGKDNNRQPVFSEGNENKEFSQTKLNAFANAANCIHHFFKQAKRPDVLDGIDLDQLSQQMCSPLFYEMGMSDEDWGLLDRHVLGFMVIVRNLEEYHTRSEPKLFEFYFFVSCNVASSIAEGCLELDENDITHDYCQKTMDKLRAIGETQGYA